MNKLLDKLAIFSLCVISAAQIKDLTLPVLAMLLAVALSALSQGYCRKKAALVAELISIALCFINPSFCCAIPLVLYDILRDKRYNLIILLIFSLMYNAFEMNASQQAIIVCSSFISYLICKRSIRLETVEQALIQTRDSSAEMNLLLKEKNKRMREEQDKEIYLATLQERNRIAREIHDNVGHLLTRSILQVGALLIINKDEIQKENLSSLNETLNSAMTSIRSSVHDLHDDSINFKLLISEAMKSLEESHNVTYDFDFENELPKQIKLCFIGIVRECVSNVIKHSNADKINLTIREHPGFYQLSFFDNGTKQKNITDSGIGLINMRERVAAIGGIINFTPSDNGFRVFISAPKNK